MKDTPTPRTDQKHEVICESWSNSVSSFPEMTEFARQLERELTAMTEQRDEWKAKYIQQNKDLGCEMMDPNGTIWDYAKKVQLKLTAMTEQQDGLRSGIDYASDQLSKVTEQRDRLAEALEHSMKHMRHSLNCPARVLWNPHPCNCQMEWAYNNAIEALQSLTPNEL